MSHARFPLPRCAVLQVSCVLSLSNLLILLLNLALSAKACSLDRTEKNLTAMQRQVGRMGGCGRGVRA